MGFNHTWEVDEDAGTVLQCSKVTQLGIASACHCGSISISDVAAMFLAVARLKREFGNGRVQLQQRNLSFSQLA